MMRLSWQAALPWTLSGTVSALAIAAWGQSFGWRTDFINAYQFFPLLGLLAFSLMWAHYMVGAAGTTVLKDVSLRIYFRATGWVVLLAIVLHPGILIYQLSRDGFGLPPGSYAAFLGTSRAWLAMLGTVSLLVFLAFELHRWYGQKLWWKHVLAAGDLAMLAIFYHSLQLGAQLQGGWYATVWRFYGLTLIAVLVRKYGLLLLRRPGMEQTTNR